MSRRKENKALQEEIKKEQEKIRRAVAPPDARDLAQAVLKELADA